MGKREEGEVTSQSTVGSGFSLVSCSCLHSVILSCPGQLCESQGRYVPCPCYCSGAVDGLGWVSLGFV